jgi:hypothetical protein
VSRIVRVPAAVNWCAGFSVVAFAVPSPKFHWYVLGVLPLLPVCVNDTDWPAMIEVVFAVNVADGRRFAIVTVTERVKVAELLLPVVVLPIPNI